MTCRKTMAAILGLMLFSFSAMAATATGTVPERGGKNMSQVILNVNAWKIYCTNYGPFVNPTAGGSGGFWGGTFNYIYGAGVWVAATTPSNVRAVACGYNPNSGQSEMGPVDPETEKYEGYLTNTKARVYLSTNATDYNEWPLVEGGKKVIRSRQDSYCKYSDANPQFTFSGETRLNVVVEQISYAWNYADNNDIVFFFFNIKNNNDYELKNCYVGPGIDCDIGNEAGTAANDRTLFDYQRNLGMQFQATPEPDWPRTGVVGFRFFQGPMNNTGRPVHITDNQYPHDIPPGDPLGMTAFTIFTIEIDPKTDEERYQAMEGVDWLTGKLDAYDEQGAEFAGDKRFMMASGPFILGPKEKVTLCVGTMAALDTVALKKASDVAQEIFNNNFELASPPTAPKITPLAGDKYVRITWDKIAETQPDPYASKIKDTTDWYDYYKGSWQYLVDKNLVDSFEIKTGASTSVKIKKGDPNPAGGTDTLKSRFNQKKMYEAFDLQGYIVYRSRTLTGLLDEKTREYVGTPYKGSSGANGYWYDKKDGIQIVRNFNSVAFPLPDTILYLPRYDTLGSDRGLVYTLIDSNVVNGLGYYYGVVAYDYQKNAYYTHKCPISLNTNPTENAVYVIPRTGVSDLKPADVNYTVAGGSDKKNGGSVDYEYQLLEAAPSLMEDNSYQLKWWHNRRGTGNIYPHYQARLFEGTNRNYSEGFDGVSLKAEGMPWGWTAVGIEMADTLNFGTRKPALVFDDTDDTLTCRGFTDATTLSFWIKGDNLIDANSKLKVEIFNGWGWTLLDTIKPLPIVGTVKTYSIPRTTIRARFIYTKSSGNLFLDDVSHNGAPQLDEQAITSDYDLYGYFSGTFSDEMRVGEGVVFRPWLKWKGDTTACKLDSLVIIESASGSRSYPRDSVSMSLQAAIFSITANLWQWRGADFEIRWKDTVNASSQPALTAQVWDLTNNCEVPLEFGVTKANMTRSSWCFGPAASQSVALIDSNNVNSTGMHLCGLTVWFNKAGTTIRRMDWPNRPETGDIWRVYTSGPRPPTDGDMVFFNTYAPRQLSSLSQDLLNKVKVVPNPYLVRADWDVSKNYPNIKFTNLPAECTIRIYTLGGDLVKVIKHTSNYRSSDGTENWDLLTTYNRRVASGIYIYQIEAPGIGTRIDKFAIIK